ncbi:MAG: DUF494 domain-containing protein [Gammaproteobacteria bacterium]|nr:DUF494 domain-containing protein [Gammaproteobacteria bacterium]
MKETMLDVLIYLVEHYMEGDDHASADPDESTLKAHLSEAGFREHDIERALGWLDELSSRPVLTDWAQGRRQPSARIFSSAELAVLNIECRGFLLFLEQNGIINSATREMIIASAMALECGELDLDRFKWVLLMILFNQPGHETAYTWLEDVVFDQRVGLLH